MSDKLPPLEIAIGRIHWANAQVRSARDKLNDAIQEMIDAEQALVSLRQKEQPDVR